MTKPLDGIRVAITEHRLTAQLRQLLERQGATVSACPLVQETPVEDAEGASRFIELCETTAVDYIIFYTGVGVDFLFRATQNPDILSKSIVLARGPKAVNALKRAHARIDIVADAPTTEGILETLSRYDLNAKSVLAQLYGYENSKLTSTLEARGARVTGISLYRYTQASDESAITDLIQQIVAGRIDAITFTSAPQVRFLMEAAAAQQMEAALVRRLRDHVVVVSIGEVTTRGLEAAGLEVHVSPGEPRIGPMVLALADYFERKRNACSTPSS